MQQFPPEAIDPSLQPPTPIGRRAEPTSKWGYTTFSNPCNMTFQYMGVKLGNERP
ncbi:MAG: hypothetical protein R3B84_17565 [Zavarzinella sp.]